MFYRYGQLSGMVEPIFGILGAVAVTVASIILPYALSFAAGAMIYIVADDILPEAHTRYHSINDMNWLLTIITILIIRVFFLNLFQWKWYASDMGYNHRFYCYDVP